MEDQGAEARGLDRVADSKADVIVEPHDQASTWAGRRFLGPEGQGQRETHCWWEAAGAAGSDWGCLHLRDFCPRSHPRQGLWPPAPVPGTLTQQGSQDLLPALALIQRRSHKVGPRAHGSPRQTGCWEGARPPGKVQRPCGSPSRGPGRDQGGTATPWALLRKLLPAWTRFLSCSLVDESKG